MNTGKNKKYQNETEKFNNPVEFTIQFRYFDVRSNFCYEQLRCGKIV